MKKLNYVSICLIIIFGCSHTPKKSSVKKPTKPSIDRTTLEKKSTRSGPADDIWHTRDTNEPYSGPVYELHPKESNRNQAGKKLLEGIMKDGKMINTVWTWWYANGNKKREERLEGIYYDANGRQKSEAYIWIDFYENGQKEFEFKQEHGENIYEKFWNMDGSIADK